MTTSAPLRLPVEDKLDALRNLDPAGRWQSLDSERYCTRCDRVINGRQIEVARGTRAHGPLRLECPSKACTATPADWIMPAARIAARRGGVGVQPSGRGEMAEHRAGFVRIDARSGGILITHNGRAAVVQRTRGGRVLSLAELNNEPTPRGWLKRWFARSMAPVASDSRTLLNLLRRTGRAQIQPLS